MTKKLPNGTWKSLEYTIERAKAAMQKHEWTTLPSAHFLHRHAYSAITHGIVKYHGGFHYFRVHHLKEENLKRPSGIWKSATYAVKQAKATMKKEGWTKIPSRAALYAHGYSSLATAIHVYHGGFRHFRLTKMKETSIIAKSGSWESIKYTVAQARLAMKRERWQTLPGGGELRKRGYSTLDSAIIKNHGGHHYFRTHHLKQQPLKAPEGVWTNQEYVLQQAVTIMKKERWQTLPGGQILRQKYSGFCGAIDKYHGGLPAFRAILDKKLDIPSDKDRLEDLLRDYTDNNSIDGRTENDIDDEEGYAPVPA